MPPSIALIGFMGSGKSTVGRIVAARLRWEFVDADEMIAERAGMSIPDIFAASGEAEFRRLESQCLADLAAASGLVIACGGGAPTVAENRSFFASMRTYYLHVSFAEFRRRTGGDRNRPLLGMGEPGLRELYTTRQGVYEEIGERVATDGLRPEDVSSRILTRLRRPREPETP